MDRVNGNALSVTRHSANCLRRRIRDSRIRVSKDQLCLRVTPPPTDLNPSPVIYAPSHPAIIRPRTATDSLRRFPGQPGPDNPIPIGPTKSSALLGTSISSPIHGRAWPESANSSARTGEGEVGAMRLVDYRSPFAIAILVLLGIGGCQGGSPGLLPAGPGVATHSNLTPWLASARETTAIRLPHGDQRAQRIRLIRHVGAGRHRAVTIRGGGCPSLPGGGGGF